MSEGPKMTKKRDPEATREALLDAAEVVFLEKGFGNTALSEIANRAGLTKSLIHHYFGSKKNLWREVKQRRFDTYGRQQLDMLSDAPPTEDLLRNSVELYFRFLKNNTEIVQILAWMFLERDMDECLTKDQKLIEAGLEKIRAGQEAGHLRSDVDARFILFIFLGLAQHWFQDKDHFLHDFGTDGLPEDIDEAYLGDMLKIFMEGVRPR